MHDASDQISKFAHRFALIQSNDTEAEVTNPLDLIKINTDMPTELSRTGLLGLREQRMGVTVEATMPGAPNQEGEVGAQLHAKPSTT